MFLGVVDIKKKMREHPACVRNKAAHFAVKIDREGGGMLKHPALTTGCPVVQCAACGSKECRTVGFDQIYAQGVLATELYDLVCSQCKALTSIGWAVEAYGLPSFGIRQDDVSY